MAQLLEQQGHHERALGIVRELAEREPDEALHVWRAELERAVAERSLADAAKAVLASATGSSVSLPSVGEAHAVAWCVDEDGLERGRVLLGAEGALTLRIVRVLSLPGHTVEVRQDDRPVETSGWSAIDVPAKTRVVAAVGLLEADRFVSIAHAAS